MKPTHILEIRFTLSCFNFLERQFAWHFIAFFSPYSGSFKQQPLLSIFLKHLSFWTFGSCPSDKDVFGIIIFILLSPLTNGVFVVFKYLC